MAGHTIANDDLGDWGESQFRVLCSASGLVANKAERDKMGWDFLVELPPGSVVSGMPLDHRPNALRCLVQVKTQWRREDDRFEMTLPAAERLAKEPGPSFVVVFTAEQYGGDGDPKLVDCHVIHMLDDNLARILKRLRESEADSQAKPLAGKTVSFSPQAAGERIPPDGRSLREALLQACGPDIHEYVAAKSERLKNLGYSAGRYQLNTVINASNMDEFVDVMLGLRPVTVDRLATFDTRFDVLVPVDHVQPGSEVRLQFKPGPHSKCIVRVHGKGVSPPAVFEAEVFMPVIPSIPKKHLRMLIKAQFFTLDVAAAGRVSLNLQGKALFNASLELDEWRNYLRLLQLLGSRVVELSLAGSRVGDPHTRLCLRPSRVVPQEPWLAPLAEVVRQGEQLLMHAGAKGRAIKLTELGEAGEMIHRAYGSLFEPSILQARTFETDSPSSLEFAIPDIDFLEADYAIFAGVTLAYAVRVTMRPEPSGDGLLWRQVDWKPERLAIIEETGAAFKAFVAITREQTRLENVIVHELFDQASDTTDEHAESI